MSRILIVLTASNTLTLADGSLHPTGFWAEEFVVAHRELRAAGHDISIATPGGQRPPVDPASLEGFADYLAAVDAELAHPLDLATVTASDFDAFVLPGGHGPMTDLAHDAALGALLIAADEAGAVIAPFCHGPAGLLSASRPDGSFAFAGRRLAVFTDEEERTGGTGERSPWFVASALAERGAIIETGAAWSSVVVRDGNLISGQNPQSSEAVTAAVVEALRTA